MPRRNPVVALLTDFGQRDHYVGVMKGVMMAMCPRMNLLDITHEVEPQNIAQGSYLLWASYRYMPRGTVIVGVVDPGVGSHRQILVARTGKHIFVAPNNGLLDLVLWEEGVKSVTSVDIRKVLKQKFAEPSISSTFHGRDVLAPVAAHLAMGKSPRSLGPTLKVDLIAPPFVDAGAPHAAPRILHVDRFGNIVTNIRTDLPLVRNRSCQLKVEGRTISTWIDNYASAPHGEPCLIAGSSGLVEIVVKGQSASQVLSLKHADSILVREV